MEKVAVYVSFKDKNKKSVEYTLNSIANWCMMKNYDYTIYLDKIKDNNSNNRRELNTLKEAVKNKKVKKIIIKSLIHISSNPIKSAKFLKFLEDNNCQIESMDGLNLDLYKNVFSDFDTE